MPAVSNRSPLIVYAKIGRLALLRAVFGEVLAPPGVHDEVVPAGVGRPGAAEVRDAPSQPAEPAGDQVHDGAGLRLRA